jgi:hypothetical protein
MEKISCVVIQLIIFTFLLQGQNRNYKSISDEENQVINDFTSTFAHNKRRVILSPIISDQISSLNIESAIFSMENEYGFNLNYLYENQNYYLNNIYIDRTKVSLTDTRITNNKIYKNGKRLFETSVNKLVTDSFLIKNNSFYSIMNVDTLFKLEKNFKEYYNARFNEKNDSIVTHFEKNRPRQYPNICKFNKILFSKDRVYSLIEYRLFYPFAVSWGGEGGVILMKKQGEKWVFLEQVITMI